MKLFPWRVQKKYSAAARLHTQLCEYSGDPPSRQMLLGKTAAMFAVTLFQLLRSNVLQAALLAAAAARVEKKKEWRENFPVSCRSIKIIVCDDG